ncbi:MAG TPA: hypothetical protein VH277_05315 [Gemmatimonadaceae bacterium]|jgi:hypothetical protein|nr:hypothetical protein [Gemmatimonadaceae bacterium]
MFAACLFCNQPLGSNETFETFPVGRRLAFDASKGRLWVVCPHCERWNLSPLEERWEAIENAERLYRDTRKRIATDNIGLAKLRDGTTIVRIGEPLRPEFAAWRYGDQFGRRRRNQMIVAGGALAAVGGLIVGGAVAGVGIGGFAGVGGPFIRAIIRGRPNTVVARVPSEQHGVLPVRRRHLGESTIGRAADGSMHLHLRFINGSADFEGREAERVAALVIPKVNRYGGAKETIRKAVDEIEAGGGSEGYLDRLTRTASVYTRPLEPSGNRWRQGREHREALTHGLFGLPRESALALEMALHEEVEQRAMLGELAELERAWRDAEEIAGIADSLLVPAGVDEAFRRIKGS